MVDFSEPFQRLLTQGMVLKDGEVMSKSKGNIVDPDSMIRDYGADALRLFILFAAPPETELEWEQRGLEGAFKFLNRVWRIQDNFPAVISEDRAGSRLSIEESSREKDKADAQLLTALHKTLKKVTLDFGEFKFNTAIASLMELTNAIYQMGADKEVFSNLIIMLSPITPHFCEELWEILGNKESIFKAAWPKHDPKLLVEENVELAIQVNGKVRSKIEVPRDIPEAQLKELVLKDEKLAPWLQGKPLKKFILVPQKLVNIVI